MSNLVRKKVNGSFYYSLVDSKRVAGKEHPKQEVQQYLGRYDQAVSKIGEMRIPLEEKQSMLTKLARLEGLLKVGDLLLPAKSYSCLVLDPPWHYDLRKDDLTHRNRIPYHPMQTEAIMALPIASSVRPTTATSISVFVSFVLPRGLCSTLPFCTLALFAQSAIRTSHIFHEQTFLPFWYSLTLPSASELRQWQQ